MCTKQLRDNQCNQFSLIVHILGQVHALNRRFKLPYTSHVFGSSRQAVGNFYNTIAKSILSNNIHTTVTYKRFADNLST